MIRIRLVGVIAAEVDGREVQLPPGRPTEVLAWLATHPGRHARADVAPRFWPDVPDPTSRASLRTALWALRKALGPAAGDALRADRTSVGLEGDHIAVDLLDARRSTDPDEVLHTPIDSVLPGIEADWADEVRAEHLRAVQQRIEAVAEHAEARGDAPLALAAVRRLTELDPFSEAHHRRLLRMLRDAGETGTALKLHEQFRLRLWEDLQVRPSAMTETLVRHLVSESGTTDPERELPARLLRADSPVFVGREGEWVSLLDAWARTADGPRLALVSGESGIGKSCLAARVAQAAFDGGGTVLHGTAAEDSLLPAEPFLQAVGETGRVPVQELVDSVGHRIVTLAAEVPTLLVLDDFHRADRYSFALLRRLALADAARLAILVLFRPERATEARLANLARALPSDQVVQLHLGPLSSTATSTLLAGLDPEGTLGAHADRLHVDTGGNPLFIHELVRYLLESGGPRDGSAVPPTVRELVLERLGHLRSSEAIAAAAVLGERSDLNVLRHISTAARDPLDELEDAVALGLVQEESAGTHVFRHALVRQAVYEGLSLSRRADLHRRAAEAIESLHGDGDGPHLCDIAEHRCAATPPADPADAVAAAERAGRWAIDHHAYERAVVLLTRALEICGDEDRQPLAVARAVAFQRLTHVFIDGVAS